MPDRRWMRIIPVAFLMYTIAFVDRTNISLALPVMSRDLHMNPQQAGSAAGSAMGLINALGNLGGYFGPLAVGYFNQQRAISSTPFGSWARDCCWAESWRAGSCPLRGGFENPAAGGKK